jgi:hypothetical protein
MLPGDATNVPPVTVTPVRVMLPVGAGNVVVPAEILTGPLMAKVVKLLRFSVIAVVIPDPV